jgi:hypothetical protein
VGANNSFTINTTTNEKQRTETTMINTNHREIQIYKDPIFKTNALESTTDSSSISYNHSQSSFGQKIDKFKPVKTNTNNSIHTKGNTAQVYKFLSAEELSVSPTLKSVNKLRREHKKQLETKTKQLRHDIFTELNNQIMGETSDKEIVYKTNNDTDDNNNNNNVETTPLDKRVMQLRARPRLQVHLPHSVNKEDEEKKSIENEQQKLKALIEQCRREDMDAIAMPIFSILHPIDQIKESLDFPPELLSETDTEHTSLFDALDQKFLKEQELQQSSIKKPKYGQRWYVTPDKWTEMETHVEEEEEDFLEKYKNDPDVKNKISQLSSLCSSRMFKEYLLRSKKSVPIWLKDVAVSPNISRETQESVIPTALMNRNRQVLLW